MKKKKLTTIAADALADLSNLTKRRLYQLAEENRIPHPKEGKFPRDETLRGLFRYYQRDAELLKHERLLAVRANRQLREVELGIKQGFWSDNAKLKPLVIGIITAQKALLRDRLERAWPLMMPAEHQERCRAVGVQLVDDICDQMAALGKAVEKTAPTPMQKQEDTKPSDGQPT